MKKNKVPEIEYSDFSERIHKKASVDRLPIAGSLEVTFRCNFKCIHCYCVNEKPKDELSYDRICSILDEMAGEGCLWLLLTGGEPFIRNDFMKIYHYARSKGIIVSVFTNGSMITEEIAREFEEIKPFIVEVSLYGMSPESYEIITGKAENFYKVINGIDLLKKKHVPLKLKSMIFKQNVHELDAIKQFASEKGIPYRFDPVLNPTLSGSSIPVECMLTPAEITRLDTEDIERFEGWEKFCEKFVKSSSSNRLYPCGAGRWNFHVDPEGKMSVCMFARQKHYDLLKGSLKEGFYTFFHEVLGKKRTRETKCSDCKLRNLCGQCPGWAYLHNGNEEEPVEYLCEIAHARALAFNIEKN